MQYKNRIEEEEMNKKEKLNVIRNMIIIMSENNSDLKFTIYEDNEVVVCNDYSADECWHDTFDDYLDFDVGMYENKIKEGIITVK